MSMEQESNHAQHRAFVKMQTMSLSNHLESARSPDIQQFHLACPPKLHFANEKISRDWGHGGSSSGPNDAAITKVKLWPGRVQNDQSDWDVFFILSLYIYIYIHICFEDFWRISRNHQESRRPQNFYPDDHKTDVHNVQGLRRSRPCIHGSSLCITVSPQISTSTSTAWSVPVLPIPEIQKKEFCHTGWLFQQNSFWF